MEAFRIAVPEAVIDDLHRRLDGAILPEQTPGPDWSEGIPPSVLRVLVERWRALDWRAVEERLNAYAQAVANAPHQLPGDPVMPAGPDAGSAAGAAPEVAR